MSARIVIADDAAFMREMLCDIVTEAGYEVVAQARDGEEAVRAWRELQPDVVTLDIVMPCKSGLEALREIRALCSTARVIMCTALGQESLVKEAMDAGAVGYVVKPFRPEEVTAALANAIEKSGGGA
jgi:two-component system chemotaxis response regulator CheY